MAFLVDDTALIPPHPIVAIELTTGLTLRVPVMSLWVIENNMSGGKPLSQYVESSVEGVYFWPAGGISLAPDPSAPGRSIDGYRDPRRFPRASSSGRRSSTAKADKLSTSTQPASRFGQMPGQSPDALWRTQSRRL